ncbi:hypothetical protein BG015_008515 [Linnemannia schmuckeri]|uniref:Uncharacterized protein n=1 Tax=Linnemannia schmuckeri TaxID=64567 RepID=A0A9P5S7K2_9FUNG|nr:hypothetical protein BG015_008515 [Linnemannia schmuckeri]
MLPQGDDSPTDQPTGDSPAAPSDISMHSVVYQQQEDSLTPASPTATTPTTSAKLLVKAITTTLSTVENIPLTFCNRPPLPFHFPSPGSPGTEHDETIIRMVDDEQSWGDIEAFAGVEAFDRYYSFLDPGLEEFWTRDKIEQLNDTVIDLVVRSLKPCAATILKGTHHHQQWHSKNNNNSMTTSNRASGNNNDSESEDAKKIATIYPVVVMSAWMDMFRWEKVARSVSSSPLVCQHIWQTFGDGRPFTKEEQPFLDAIKAAAIENGARISAIKEATARVEAAKAKAAQEEADRLEVERLEVIRIQAAKEEEERNEAARIKAMQEEADKLDAERLEEERIVAAEAAAKRVEANKIRAMKRKAKADAAKADTAKADAAREEAEKEAKARKSAKKKKSSESRAAKGLTARQQNVVMQKKIGRKEATKQKTARAGATRGQTAIEVNEDTFGTSKTKREKAVAAAKAWEIAVRGVAARKAEIQSVAIKRQRNVLSGQAGLGRDQDLPPSPVVTGRSKRKIRNIEVYLPPTTLISNATTATADQENRSRQQDTIVTPPTLRSSASSTSSCTSLISPAPSPLDESLDFQLSKRTRRCLLPENLSGKMVTSTVTTTTSTPTTLTTELKSTTNTTLSATLLTTHHDTLPKASFTPPSLPPSSFPQDTEAYERMHKLTMMKQVLIDSVQSMELQRHDQQVETNFLLRQRDAAIEAAKARQREATIEMAKTRQRGGSNTSNHHEKNRAAYSQDSPENPMPAFFNISQESTPVPTGLPSPVTPNQSSLSLSPRPAAAAPKATSLVIDLTNNADRIPASTKQQRSQLQQFQRAQQQQHQNLQQIPETQQYYQQQQYLVQQHLQQNQQSPPCTQQPPIINRPQPTKPSGQPAQSIQSSSSQFSQHLQQMQEFIQQQMRKSPELHKLHQQHVLEREQLLKQQQQDRERLAQEQQLMTAQHQANQRHVDEQLRLQAANKWRHQEQVWLKRSQEIQQQEQVFSLKLTGHRQQTQQLQQTILNEQKQWQQQPAVTLDRIKQIHTYQRVQLATSQQQRYSALQSVPVTQQAQAMANLNRMCQTETQMLMARQMDTEEKAAQDLHRQEASKKAVQRLQLQLHQVLKSEKAVMKQLDALHAQKQEQDRRRVILLQEHQLLQQGLPIMPASWPSLPQGLTAGQGTAPLNMATSQQQQHRQLKEKYAMDERLRQQLSQKRDILRKQHLQEQVDLQQAHRKALSQQARSLAEMHVQRLTQAISQCQSWLSVQTQAQQQQARMTTVQEQQVSKDGSPAVVSPTFAASLNQPSATNPISMPIQPAPAVLDPTRPQPLSQPQATATSQPKQPTPQLSEATASGSDSSSAEIPPRQQSSPESTVARSKLAAIFPFPNPLYDITEWTAEDKNRLWTTWLEVGDDWEQISTKGLQGKYSVDACRAVILGTAS